MTLTEFLTGPPRYDRSATSGPAFLVVPVVGFILIAGQVAAVLVQIPLAMIGDLLGVVSAPAPRDPPMTSGSGEITSVLRQTTPSTGEMLGYAFASQIAIVLLTLAGPKVTTNLRALKLGPPAGGSAAYLYALGVMVPLVLLFNALAYMLAPESFAKDFQAFRDLAKSSGLLVTALAIGVGAPLSEELLFRGYLLSSLAASALGYWPGALLATAGWALLHINYSWVGLIEVFLIGVYFSWLLWRTGSLLPALLCHAVYNTCLLAVLRFALV